MNIFKKIWNDWRHDIVHNPWLFWVEICSTALNMGASAIFALTSGGGNTPLILIFIMWIIGSIGMAWASYKRNAAWLLVLMTFYTVMNIVGLSNLVL
jgi:hypothetical protein